MRAALGARGCRARGRHPHHQVRPDLARADLDRLTAAVHDARSRAGWRRRARAGRRRRAASAARGRVARLTRLAGRERLARGLEHLADVDRLAGCGSALPDSSRETSSRFSTRRESRWPSLDHRFAQLVALLGAGAGRIERGAGGDDRGQRRAQVVGDRAQQRGLELVAAPQRLGLDRLGLHAVTLARRLLQLGQRPRRLLAAALGLGGARPRQLGQGATGDGDDREDDEGDEVVLVGDVEAAGRRDVEPVEGEGAEDGGQEADAQAPEGRQRQHPGDEDDAERYRLGDRLQRQPEQGAGGGDEERREDAEPGRRRGAAQSDADPVLGHRRERMPASKVARFPDPGPTARPAAPTAPATPTPPRRRSGPRRCRRANRWRRWRARRRPTSASSAAVSPASGPRCTRRPTTPAATSCCSSPTSSAAPPAAATAASSTPR